MAISTEAASRVLSEAVLSLIGLYEALVALVLSQWEYVATAVGIILATTALVVFYEVRKRQQEVQRHTEKRVRKRDVMKVLVKQAADRVGLRGRRVRLAGPDRRKQRQRDKIAKTMRKLYDMAKGQASMDQPASRFVRKPPPADLLSPPEKSDDDDIRLPLEVRLTLQSMRIFGHFDEPVFLELYRYTDVVRLQQGQFLFRIGQADDAMYIVQQGQVNLYVKDSGSGDPILMSEIGPGEHVSSLLSVLDTLTGMPSQYRTVEAMATQDDTVIIRLPFDAFNKLVKSHYPIYKQFVQVIATRLQRVTLLALNQFLGLSHELLRPMAPPKPPFSLEQLGYQPEDVQDAGRANDVLEAVCWQVVQTLGLPADQAKIRASDTEGKAEKDKHAPQPAAAASEQIDGSDTSDKTDKSSSTAEEHDEDPRVLARMCHAMLRSTGRFAILRPGQVLVKQGDRHSDMFFVVTGSLRMTMRAAPGSPPTVLGLIKPGEMTGELAVLSGIESFFSLVAAGPTIVVRLPQDTVKQGLTDARFRPVVDELVKMVMSRLSPLVRQVDFGLDWLHVDAGRVVYRQGQRASSIYILLSGRLRSVVELETGAKELVREFGRFEMVGDLEVLTESKRATSVHAVRDSELAKIPSGLLQIVMRRHNQVSAHVMRMLGERLLTTIKGGDVEEAGRANLSTVALVPVSKDVPMSAFAEKLCEALNLYCRARHLNAQKVEEKLKFSPSTAKGSLEAQLISYLAAQEDAHDIILYETDYGITKWSQRCIRQADCILVVGLGDRDPTCGPLEGIIDRLAERAQKELVLLHSSKTAMPSGTAEWLNMRTFCSAHHHIRCEADILPSTSKHSEKKNNLLSFLMGSRDSSGDLDDTDDSDSNIANEVMLDRMMKDKAGKARPPPLKLKTRSPQELLTLSDFGRLARRLCGRTVALVLGGGGARGMAHIGVIRALEEAGIPVDMVGGTSIGAFVGAMYAEERSYHGTMMDERITQFCKNMSSTLSMALDITYPSVSLFTGRAFNREIRDTFGERQIEDLWIPYFCVSTDITASRKVIHNHGSLWHYVRASMSLHGYLPPICDPEDGHLLLDGGYVDVLPVDVAREHGADTIFAVDVSSKESQDLDNYGDDLSGWWLLWRKLNPFLSKPKIPDLQDISQRLAFISSTNRINQISLNPQGIEYIHPPVETYAVLDWVRQTDIESVGYEFMKPLMPKLPNKRWAPRHENQDDSEDDEPSSPISPLTSGRPLSEILFTSPRRVSVSADDWRRLRAGRDDVLLRSTSEA